MLLHEYVRLIERLNQFLDSSDLEPPKILNDLQLYLDMISDFDIDQKQTDISNSIAGVTESYKHLTDTIRAVIKYTESKIDVLAQPLMQPQFELSKQSMVDNENGYRTVIAPEAVKSEVVGAISKHVDVSYPTLEIGPGQGIWTDFLVAGDPLYLVDIHQEFLDYTASKYPAIYQNRLRRYLVGHKANTSDCSLHRLPQNQFGFVFAWNVFNYFPINYFTEYLDSVYKVLRPGGIFLFNYNNCEDSFCAKLAEQKIASWMPKKLLFKLIQDQGFEIIKDRSVQQSHWVEIAKPGKKQTIKMGQALGEICVL